MEASGKEVTSPSLEKVLITWQKDDSSPFVAIRLKHENCFGGLIDRIATRFSTWKGSGMLGKVDVSEWRKRSQELRRQWLEFIR